MRGSKYRGRFSKAFSPNEHRLTPHSCTVRSINHSHPACRSCSAACVTAASAPQVCCCNCYDCRGSNDGTRGFTERVLFHRQSHRIQMAKSHSLTKVGTLSAKMSSFMKDNKKSQKRKKRKRRPNYSVIWRAIISRDLVFAATCWRTELHCKNRAEN